MIDFSLPAEHVELRDRVTAFVRDEVVPRESDPRQDEHGPSDELRLELVGLARAAGLLSPHAPVAWGGLGLDHRGMAVVFEAAADAPTGERLCDVVGEAVDPKLSFKSEFTQTTNQRLVSMARPGPSMSSHQPGVGSASLEAACADGDSPVTISSALSHLALSSPQVS